MNRDDSAASHTKIAPTTSTLPMTATSYFNSTDVKAIFYGQMAMIRSSPSIVQSARGNPTTMMGMDRMHDIIYVYIKYLSAQ